MNWQISKLSIDFNTGQATMVVDSLPYPTQSLTLNFLMPEMAEPKKSPAQTLENLSRTALMARAKTVLTEIVGSL